MENDDYEEFASDGIFEAPISCYTVTATSSTLLASLLITELAIAVVATNQDRRLVGLFAGGSNIFWHVQRLGEPSLVTTNLKSCHDLAQLTKDECSNRAKRSYAPSPPTNFSTSSSRILSEKKGTSTAMYRASWARMIAQCIALLPQIFAQTGLSKEREV